MKVDYWNPKPFSMVSIKVYYLGTSLQTRKREENKEKEWGEFPDFIQQAAGRTQNWTPAAGVPELSFLFSELCCALDNLVALSLNPLSIFGIFPELNYPALCTYEVKSMVLLRVFFACFSYYEIDWPDRNYCCSAHSTCMAFTGSSTWYRISATRIMRPNQHFRFSSHNASVDHLINP